MADILNINQKVFNLVLTCISSGLEDLKFTWLSEMDIVRIASSFYDYFILVYYTYAQNHIIFLLRL